MHNVFVDVQTKLYIPVTSWITIIKRTGREYTIGNHTWNRLVLSKKS
jgi:hypothetical protein